MTCSSLEEPLMDFNILKRISGPNENAAWKKRCEMDLNEDDKEIRSNEKAQAKVDVESLLATNEQTTRLLMHNKCSKCFLHLRVLFLIIIIMFLSTISSILLYEHLTVCTTPECVSSGDKLIRNMDNFVDPCQDFYRYSCGSFINSSVNLNYPSWNMLYKTTIAAHDRLVRTMLEASDGRFPHKLNRGEQSAVKVFRQCTDQDMMALIGVEPVKKLMKEFGGWMPDLYQRKARRSLPLSELLAVVDDETLEEYILIEEEVNRLRKRRETQEESFEDLLLRFFNMSTYPIVFAGVQVSYENSSENIITIYEQVPLLIESRFYQWPLPTVEEIISSHPDRMSPRGLLFSLGMEMTELLGEQPEGYKERLAEMMILEWRITHCKPRETTHDNELYEVISLRTLQELAPTLDWKYFLSALIGEDLTFTERIAIKPGREWLLQFNELIQEYTATPEKRNILKSYMRWKILMFYLSYTKTKCNDKSSTLSYLMQLYSGPQHLRKEFCVFRLSGIFPLSLPSLMRKMDGEDNIKKTKEYVKDMAEKIRAVYKDQAFNSDALDDNTRNHVMAKLGNMSMMVSYPDKMEELSEVEIEADRAGNTFFESMIVGPRAVYRKNINRLRLPVDQRDWIDTKPAFSSVPTYNYERNLVTLPMDALNAPIAHYLQVDSMNYGAIGSYIGHEMTHAFDGEGRYHGPTGDLGFSWWSPESKEKYEANEDCIVQHYANITHSDKALQSRFENMADNTGLDVAFKAWKKYGKDKWIRLPGLPLTPEQRFFVSYAQGWCALDPAGQQGGKHLTERLRVMGTLQNSEAFSSAFKCPIDSPMNPGNKCKAW